MKKLFLIVFCTVAIQGCVTTMTVSNTTEDSDAKGVRYALPTMMLSINPDKAGKTDFTVEAIAVPDKAREYAVHADTVFGKYDLDLTISDGLLKRIQFAPNDTEVAGQVFDTAATLAAKEAELEASASAAAKTKKQELEKAIYEARLALEQARIEEAKLNIVWKNAANDAKAAAWVAWQNGIADVKKKEIALAYAEDALSSFESDNLGILARPTNGGSGKYTGGPMLFKVVDTVDPSKCRTEATCPGKLALVALDWNTVDASGNPTSEAQLPLETFAKPEPDKTPKPPKQLTGSLIYGTSDDSFWRYSVNFSSNVPPAGKLTQLVWKPYKSASSAIPIDPNCSSSFNDLPHNASKDLLQALGEKVTVAAVATQAVFTLPKACFPSGFYKFRAEFPMANGTKAGADATVHLCEKQECANETAF